MVVSITCQRGFSSRERAASPIGLSVAVSGMSLLSIFAFPVGSDGFDLLAERPDEARELARDGDDDLVAVQPAGREPPVACAEPQLRAPGEIGDRFREPGLAARDAHRDARTVA